MGKNLRYQGSHTKIARLRIRLPCNLALYIKIARLQIFVYHIKIARLQDCKIDWQLIIYFKIARLQDCLNKARLQDCVDVWQHFKIARFQVGSNHRGGLILAPSVAAVLLKKANIEFHDKTCMSNKKTDQTTTGLLQTPPLRMRFVLHFFCPNNKPDA